MGGGLCYWRGSRNIPPEIDRSSSWSSILHWLSRQATPMHRCWIRCCWAWQPWRPFWPWPLLESWQRSTGSTPPADPEVQSTLPSYASRLMQVQPPRCTLRPSRRSMTSIRTSYPTSMVSPSAFRSLRLVVGSIGDSFFEKLSGPWHMYSVLSNAVRSDKIWAQQKW